MDPIKIVDIPKFLLGSFIRAVGAILLFHLGHPGLAVFLFFFMEMGQRFMLRLTAALLIATSKKLMEAVTAMKAMNEAAVIANSEITARDEELSSASRIISRLAIQVHGQQNHPVETVICLPNR